MTADADQENIVNGEVDRTNMNQVNAQRKEYPSKCETYNAAVS